MRSQLVCATRPRAQTATSLGGVAEGLKVLGVWITWMMVSSWDRPLEGGAGLGESKGPGSTVKTAKPTDLSPKAA